MSDLKPSDLKEIWSIVRADGGLVPAHDDPPGAVVYMLCATKEDAEKLCEHQDELYHIDTKPVRLFH